MKESAAHLKKQEKSLAIYFARDFCLNLKGSCGEGGHAGTTLNKVDENLFLD
jgi:hypothetical protein